MSENGKERFILTKSYEIAYAIFRIAAIMPEKDFAERLRASAAGMLEAGAVQDYAAARKSLQIAECLVKFAGDTSLMGSANADTLLREVYVLDAAVIERMQAAKESAIDLSEIFSKPVSISPDGPIRMDAEAEAETEMKKEEAEMEMEMEKEMAETNAANAAKTEPEKFAGFEHAVAASAVEPRRSSAERVAHNAASAIQASGVSFIKAEIRQAAIIDRIRQSGNCHLKDLQEVLPGCSERTIRYDVQSLMEQNVIERIGNGGPSVFYQMRQMEPVGRG